MEPIMEPDVEPALESPKRNKFSFPFFRRNRDKKFSPQNAEVAERKMLVEEGHKYLAEATDLIHQHGDHLHRKDPGLEQMLGDRWAELYGSAPSGKKLTKGRLTPEDFRDKAQTLLANVQEQFEFLKLDEQSPGSSVQHHEQSREEPADLKRSMSVRREPSQRQKTELRDDGPRPRDVQFDTSPQRSPREATDPSYSSRKGLTRHARDDKDDRHARQGEVLGKRVDAAPRVDDRRPSEQSKHSTSERTKTRDEGDRPRRKDDREDRYRDDRDDRYRDRYHDKYSSEDRRRRDRDDRYYKEDRDRYRDDRYRDDRYRGDRYRDDRYRDDRYRDDRYRDDRYRDDRRRDDRYYDDRRSYDRRRDDRRYYDRSYDDRRGDDRRYSEDRPKDSRRGEDRRRDDHRRKEGRREGDDPRRQDSDDHQMERQSPSQQHGDEAARIPVPMSPTYIPYPGGEDEKPRRRSSRRHREQNHSSDNHPQTPMRSRNHSPSQQAEFVTDPELLSPDPDSKRNSHQSLEEPPQ